MEKWDIIILGAGCAGLTAGLYAARAGKRTLILEHKLPGGQTALTGEIHNYPGLPGIDGVSLTQRMAQQAQEAGAVLRCTAVENVRLAEKRVETAADVFCADALILAVGAEPKPLGIPGEARFRGRCVSYCASCDGFFYRNREVYVVGGGNSAGEEALHLAELAQQVHMLVRKDRLRCEAAIARRLEHHPKIRLEYNRALREILGTDNVEALVIENTATGQQVTVPAQGVGVFIFVGYRPATAPFAGELPMDENGYLLTDDRLETPLPGIFAAGDVRQKPLRQIVTAVSDGAIAAVHACKYCSGML